MDLDPHLLRKTIEEPYQSSDLFVDIKSRRISLDEDDLIFEGPAVALVGLLIAIISIGVPLIAVLTERPPSREILVPTAFKSDGSKSSQPFTSTGFSQPDS